MTPADVCVLIPAYNEEKNISSVVNAVRSQGFCVLVVDDGSTDSSRQIIPSLKVDAILSAKNEGKGASLRKGLRWFLDSPCKAVVFMDGDGQHAPDELRLFVEALAKGADVVVGNRLWKPKGMPPVRLATNRVMSWLLSRKAGQPISDTQCGYRAMSRRAVQSLSLGTDRFEAESEMLLDASAAGFKIEAVPVSTVYRDEVSHIRPVRDTMRFLKFYFSDHPSPKLSRKT